MVFRELRFHGHRLSRLRVQGLQVRRGKLSKASFINCQADARAAELINTRSERAIGLVVDGKQGATNVGAG